jgi:hypothetical protein
MFEKISIEPITVRVEEFDAYTALVKAAEAFSQCVLKKRERNVVDLINKTTGNKFKVSDFSGGVKIELLRQNIEGIAFKVTFGLSDTAKKQKGFNGPADLILITKAEKIKEGFPQKAADKSQKILRTDTTPRFGREFEYRGAKYFIE